MMSPKISVITINFNNLAGLKKTIQSILSQDFTNYEYIIIDGGSSDGSKEYIEKYEEILKYWVSENDNGIYHAMNKGIGRADGDYLLFLNSGDSLNMHDSLTRLIYGNNGEDIIYGDLLMVRGEESWLKTHPSIITFDFFLSNTLPHPGSLIKKELLKKVGLFSEQYKIVADWEFFMNAICLHSASYRHVPFPVSVFHENGISSDPENEKQIISEKEEIYKKNYKAFIPDYKRMHANESKLNLVQISKIHRLAFGFQKLNENIKRVFKRK